MEKQDLRKPICYEALTKEEFDKIIKQGFDDMEQGRTITVEQARAEIEKLIKKKPKQ